MTNRSLINSSIQTHDIGEFIIQPEFLDEEELAYEMRIRRLFLGGNRREQCTRLRECINREKGGVHAIPLTGYSVPSEEIDLCKSKLTQIEQMLEQVTNETPTQNRFMTKYLHVESRLNRIPSQNTIVNMTQEIASTNQALSNLFNTFIARVRDYRMRRRLDNNPPRIEDVFSDDENNGAGGGQDKGERVTVEPNLRLEHVHPPLGQVEQSDIIGGNVIPPTLQDNDGTYDNGQLLSIDGDQRQDGMNGEEIVVVNNNRRESQVQNRQTNDFELLGQVLRQNAVPARESELFGLHGNNMVPNALNQFANGQIMTSSRVNEYVDPRFSMVFGENRISSMPPLPRYPNVMPQYQANRTQQNRDYNREFIPPRSHPHDVRFSGTERSYHAPQQQQDVLHQVLSAIHTLTDRVETISQRVDDVEVRNHTYTVDRNVQTPNSQFLPEQEPVAASVHSYRVPQRDFRANAPNNNFHNKPTHRVPINKWNLYFTANQKSDIPEEKDVRAFLKRLEVFRTAEGMSEQDVYQRFTYLLKGTALDWYTRNISNFRNWLELKAGLEKQYTNRLNKFVAAAQLASKRQEKGQSASDYIASIIRDFDTMEITDEEEKISIIQNGLLPGLRGRAMSRDWNSVQELEIWLRKAEIADKLYYQEANKNDTNKKFFVKRSTMAMSGQATGGDNVNEVIYEEVSENDVECNDEINRVSSCNVLFSKRETAPNKKVQTNVSTNKNLNTKETRYGKLTCFNCFSNQHLFRDCDKPIHKMFCFRCGKENVLAPNCDCKAKKEGSKNISAVSLVEAGQSGDQLIDLL